MGVAERFSSFLSNIALTQEQKNAGGERRERVVKVLNLHYWNSSSETSNSRFVGSWGKYTRLRPPRDVDVLFELPKAVYDRFEARSGNKQSQLLQEVRDVLSKSFPNTRIRGDGPVVIAPFSKYDVEVIPAFKLTSNQHLICMTDSGGHYKATDYAAEEDSIKTSNSASSGQTRDLVKMTKRWQAHSEVPIKSFWIELLAVSFLSSWEHRGKPKTYHDYMVRDFLQFIVTRPDSYLIAPGTYESMSIGSAWLSKAKTAHGRAVKACEYELSDIAAAGEEWQKIFGTDIPRTA